MTDHILKNHQLSFPKPYIKGDDSNLNKFLKALAKTDGTHQDDIQLARPERFTMSANGRWLEVRGSNFLRPRPDSFNMDDPTYRELIRLMTFTPMQVYAIFNALADFFLGENSIANDLAKIFSVEQNLIEIQIKRSALIVAAKRGLIGATYLHKDHLLSNDTEFYSGYIFPNSIVSTLSPPTHAAGATTLDISQNIALFPLTGEVVCVGTFGEANYECLYYTSRVGDILNLLTPLQFSHAPGENVYIPVFISKNEITLEEELTIGNSYGQIATSNSADFPDSTGVVWFDWHLQKAGGLDERVPYKARINNTSITLDSNYVFKKTYPIGSKITLCAKTPKHDINGTDFPFYINGTASLVDYLKEIFLEVKAEGIRAQIDFID